MATLVNYSQMKVLFNRSQDKNGYNLKTLGCFFQFVPCVF